MSDKPSSSKDESPVHQWGAYMDSKRRKLSEQFVATKRGQTSEIFKGVEIFVNGYTDPSADVLRRLMQQHGGKFHQYPSHSVTHTIASNLPRSKIEKLRGYERIVKAAWVTDSLQSGCLLPEADYLLYNRPSDSLKKFLQPVPVKSIDENSSDGRSSVCSSNPSPQKDIPQRKPMAKTNDPQFLTEFYANSRLHFISALAQEKKTYVNKLREAADSNTFPGLQRLRDKFAQSKGPKCSAHTGPLVTHIDMDCFFASVGRRNHPELEGKPIAVTHSKGKGPQQLSSVPFESRAEIASCSYEARSYGLKNGMYLGEALKRCPSLVTIPYDFDGYDHVSKILYDTVAEYTLNVEAVSCDELYVDLTDLLVEFGGQVQDIITHIRNEVKDRTKCPASAGIGPNMLLARLATRHAKPDGQYFIFPADVDKFIVNEKMADIPGVGYATLEKLGAKKVVTCGDMQSLSLTDLQKEFGKKNGAHLYDVCRGKDERKLKSFTNRKSVSCDVNYGIRLQEESELFQFFDNLGMEMERRLKTVSCKGRMMTLKLLIRCKDAPLETPKFMGCGMCDVFNRSANFPTAIDQAAVITAECKKLSKQISLVVSDIRGIGITMTKLSGDSVESENSRGILSFMKQMEPKQSYTVTELPQLTDIDCVEDDILLFDLDEPVLTVEVDQPMTSKGLGANMNNVQLGLPSPSQIDQSVLDALPKEMRDEILLELKQRKDAEAASMKLVKQLGSEISKSPVSSRPRPSSKTSQNGRKSRSPAKGKAKRKLLKLPAVTMRNFLIGGEMPLTNEPKKIGKVAPMRSASASATIITSEPTESAAVDPVSSKPSLCQVSDYAGVKNFLKLWLESTEDPLEVDIDRVTVYMNELIEHRNLEQMNMLMRYFKWQTEDKNSAKWSNAFQIISVAVQSEMLSLYGKQLRL